MTARGCHVVDGMVHIAGPVATVFAFSDRRQLEIDVDDTTSCLLRFAAGTTGYLGTLHAASQFWRIHVFGSKGALEMRSVDNERVELEAFADAVADNVRFVIAPEEIVNTVAVTEAIMTSAREAKAVTIG